MIVQSQVVCMWHCQGMAIKSVSTRNKGYMNCKHPSWFQDAKDCHTCLNVRNHHGDCASDCETGSYLNASTGVCQVCHPACRTCNGSDHDLSDSGCTSCAKSVYDESKIVIKCIPPSLPCDEGYHEATYQSTNHVSCSAMIYDLMTFFTYSDSGCLSCAKPVSRISTNLQVYCIIHVMWWGI